MGSGKDGREALYPLRVKKSASNQPPNPTTPHLLVGNLAPIDIAQKCFIAFSGLQYSFVLILISLFLLLSPHLLLFFPPSRLSNHHPLFFLLQQPEKRSFPLLSLTSVNTASKHSILF